MKIQKFWIVLVILLSLSAKKTSAVSEISSQNNKFGIHLATSSKKELLDAASLVNQYGDWGYITVVIQENDRNYQKWQDAFDQMRQLHLIPIVRIASSPDGDCWRSPDPAQTDSWVDFLDSLHWVVKNRYIVLFNEPNHGSEWGKKVDPESYAQVVVSFSKALKERSADFFVMMAGFDAAAPNSPPLYEDEAVFLGKMDKSIEGGLSKLFENLDGWASHSYPNHGFVGSPLATGRNSIKTYLWELDLLRSFGVEKDLPVFITETGWPHFEGINSQKGLFSADKVAQNFSVYFDQVISDSRVVAVTPFILDYQSEPFDHFSWKKPGTETEFYPQYEQVKGVKKVVGNPVQEQNFSIENSLPDKLIKDSTYTIPIVIENQGQAIWDKEDGYQLGLLGDTQDLEYFFSDFSNLSPFGQSVLQLHLKLTGDEGEKEVKIAIFKNGQEVFSGFPWNFKVMPAVDLSLKVDLFPKLKTSSDDFTLLIFNDRQEVVFEKTNLEVSTGRGLVTDIHNVIIGKNYRVVVLKPGYLPRQQIIVLEREGNEAVLETMFPVDFNQDGRFSFSDIYTLIKNPSLIRILWLK